MTSLLWTMLFTAPIGAVEVPEGFSAGEAAAGITGAVAMAIAPDGRIVICEQTGALRLWKDGALLERPALALDVDSFWERGLIGVALCPRFPEEPHVYLSRVLAQPFPRHRISRFTLEGDAALPESEVILLEGDNQNLLGGSVPAGHQGGGLRFGKDGKLYIGIGPSR